MYFQHREQRTANREQDALRASILDPLSPVPYPLFPWPPASARRAFTLTELLVVITIIAILAGLGSVAVVQGLIYAKQTRIKVEVDGLDMALKAYKEQYGSYPPCDLRIDPAAAVGAAGYNAPLRAHVARAFPRYTGNLANDLALYVDTKNFRPDQALVFWLGGFNPDPTNPFNSPAGLGALLTAMRTPALFNFDQTRLVQLHANATPTGFTGAPLQECKSYIPQGSKTNVPYAYLDGATIASLITAAATPWWFDGNTLQIANLSSAGVCAAYFADTGGLTNLDSFQIVSAGMDDIYGAAVPNSVGSPPVRSYPSGTGYDISSNLADDDNVTNFSAKARLGDAKP